MLRKQRSLEDSQAHATCDMILRCGGSASVPVHSCILVAVSRFFRRLLTGEAVKRAGQQDLAVGIAGGALDVVSERMNFFILILLSIMPINYIYTYIYEIN